ADRTPAAESEFVEPLPDAGTPDIVSLLEFVGTRGGEEEIYHVADEMNREFGVLITDVKAAEMLGWVDTPGPRVILTSKGRAFVASGPEERKALWREQLLQLRLFRDIHEVLRRQPDRSVDRDFVLETIITRMPYENYQRIFNTFVRWARFGELFDYDSGAQRLTLQQG